MSETHPNRPGPNTPAPRVPPPTAAGGGGAASPTGATTTPVTGATNSAEASLVREIRELLQQEREALLPPKDPEDHRLDEWKECRASIARFDTILADLRKYGFSIITGLLTASTLLFAKTTDTHPQLTYGAKLGVFALLLILVFGLFVVDRYHEVFVLCAVERATALEAELDMKLTETITKDTKGHHLDTGGTWLYSLFGFSGLVALWATVRPGEGPYPDHYGAYWIPSVGWFVFAGLVFGYFCLSGGSHARDQAKRA